MVDITSILNLKPVYKPDSKRVAKYNGFTFILIKRECKRLFIKQVAFKKPFWIGKSQIRYSFESH